MKIFLVAFVVVVSATPRALKVQETAHEIARSVKNSNDYSLEEKQTILANLKAINNDAKEFASAHGHKKTELKKDLHAKMAALKEEMHENQSQKTLEEDDGKVAIVQEDITAVKAQLKSAHLSSSQKAHAKTLVRQLEESYSELAEQTSRAGRSEIARTMRATANQLKEIMTPKATFSSKKEKILETIKHAESEYASKSLPASIKSQIHSQFEEMKTEVHSHVKAAQLQATLKAKLQAIKELESSAELEEKDDDLEEEEDNEDKKESVKENDFEESNADEE